MEVRAESELGRSGDSGGTEDDRSSGPLVQPFTVLMYMYIIHTSVDPKLFYLRFTFSDTD